MSKIKIHVKKRDLGVKLNALRKDGYVPANMYGLGESVALQVNASQLRKDLVRIGDASLVYLVVGDSKKDIPVLIEEVDTPPLTEKPMHVTFRRVDMKEEVTTEVAVEMIGEVELNRALVVQVRDEIEITALPANIPEKFVIDLSQVTELGQVLTTEHLEFDRNLITIEGLSEEREHLTLVTIKDEAAEADAQEASAEAAAEAVETAQDIDEAQESAAQGEEGEAAEPASEEEVTK